MGKGCTLVPPSESLLLLKPQMSLGDSDGDGSSVGDWLADARKAGLN